jgi:hypothetical protein
MTPDAHKRQALSLAAQLPEQPEDVRAVMLQLQVLVDDFLLRTEGQPARPSVVPFRAESH